MAGSCPSSPGGFELAIDRERWRPPPQQSGRGAGTSSSPSRSDRVAGALYGSLLFEQPRHAPIKAALDAFIAPDEPLAVEVGFDHGITLLANARAFPGQRWLGVELRRKRVEAVAAVAAAELPNCLPLRVDARTLFAALLPKNRVDRVDILFPTPVVKGHHLLVTDAFVADLCRVLRPDGVVLLMTDVAGLDAWMVERFSAWRPVEIPPRAAALSRRERVCRRDGLPVWTRGFSPPT